MLKKGATMSESSTAVISADQPMRSSRVRASGTTIEMWDNRVLHRVPEDQGPRWWLICTDHDRDFGQLRAVAPSPVVDLNRAIAHSMAFGPDAGLRLLNEIAGPDADTLRSYAPLPAARGDFLFRAGRLAEARAEFQAAAALARNTRERAFLLSRADACDGRA